MICDEAFGDSAHVRAVLMSEVQNKLFALLEPVITEDVEFADSDEHAPLRVGKLTVKLDIKGWRHRA